MTAADLKHRLLKILSVNQAGSAPSYVQDSVVQAVNQAYQILWIDVPRDKRVHYTRRIDTVALVPGTNSYDLAGDVQSVVTPVFFTAGSIMLTQAARKSEVLNYAYIGGSKAAESNNARPEVFYVERLFQNEDDATKITLLLAPAPVTAENLRVEVEVDAPSFTVEEFCASSPPALRIPHDYAESTLFPIAAYLAATQSDWFTQQEKLPALEEGYNRALQRVGVTDPLPLPSQKDSQPTDT